MQTTSAEVITTFAVTPRARELLRRWQADQARQQVPRVVMRHVTRALYRLEPAHIEAACAAGEQPLRDIRTDVAMAVQPVVDWRPDFAFIHVMHLALEKFERLPTFGEFAGFCGSDPVGRTALGDPARRIREHAARLGYAPAHAAQAVRWRIGLAYYSFARELYTIAVLRGEGLDVRAHPLADALFRVDAWVDQTILCLYIRNARFRDGRSGRKPRAADILAGARPPFRYAELQLASGHVFGRVQLPEAGQIRAVAARIQRPQVR